MSQVVDCLKVVLGTKKVVLLRNPLIRDQEASMQIASARAKDNITLTLMLAQKELLKLLLLEVDGAKLSKAEIEQLDKYFTLGEYNQLLQVVAQLSGGGANQGEFQTEIVTSGAQ